MTLYIDTKPTLGEWAEKPLPDTKRTQFYVNSEFGRYGIYYGNGVYTLLLHTFVSLVIKDDMPDLFQAKAAAQADYERRTAERFVKIEVPQPIAPYYGLYQTDYIKGQHKMYELIQSAIAKAKENKS